MKDFKTLEEAVFAFRDHELNLPERMFTGQEWGDGTAQRIYREDYRRALSEKGVFIPPDAQELLF